MWLVIRGWGPIIQVRGMIQIVLYCTRFMALPDVAKCGRYFQVSKYGYDITISCKRTLHSMIRNPTFINTSCASWTFDEAYQLFPLSFYTRNFFLLSFLASLPSRPRSLTSEFFTVFVNFFLFSLLRDAYCRYICRLGVSWRCMGRRSVIR